MRARFACVTQNPFHGFKFPGNLDGDFAPHALDIAHIHVPYTPFDRQIYPESQEERLWHRRTVLNSRKRHVNVYSPEYRQHKWQGNLVLI